MNASRESVNGVKDTSTQRPTAFTRVIHRPFFTRALPGRADGVLCDRAQRKRTGLYVDDARPSETARMRDLAAPQQEGW